MKVFGLSLIALLAGSVVASPVQSRDSGLSEAIQNLKAQIETDVNALLGDSAQVKRQDVSSILADMEEIAKQLEAAYGVSKRDDSDVPDLENIDEIIDQIKASYDISKRDEVSDLLSTLVGLLGELGSALGVSEKTISDEIHELGAKRHGITTHWHKRVIRSGPNTLLPFSENPLDRIIEPNDILYVDLGPVFEAWEADFGRTYVLGDDPHKKRLRDALEPIWHKVKARYHENPDMTGEHLYEIACEAAKQDGWEFGAHLAGHLIGSFPHERIPKDQTALYITKGNQESMNTVGRDGRKRHWILEIHLRDPARQFAGFYEQLLTVT